MIGPAVSLIFIFGIFPLLFALYVSVHKWRIVRTDYLGVDNFTRAIGNLTYVAMFFLSLGALYGAFVLFRQLRDDLQRVRWTGWLLAIPGILHTAVMIAFVRYGWFQLPEFLDIAEKLRGQEKTRELFVQLIGEAFNAASVQPAWRLFTLALLVSVIGGIIGLAIFRHPLNVQTQSKFGVMWLSLVVGITLLWFTFQEIARAYTVAFEEGVDPGIWPQVITISAGVILLIGAWFLWKSATRATSNGRFILRLLTALAMLVGAWLLIGEIPTIIAAGDEDLWSGLKVTVFFSLGTVPFQLAIAMFLAILLFQRVRGSSIFRMIFFLPYVTPFIASAAIFRQLFANRDTSVINLIIRNFGGEGQAWLQESRGVFAILAEGAGIELAPWLEGPSLALTVIIIHSVWTYVGYNTVIYLAGLGNIPKDLNEAAEIDGANRWDTFRHITFPLLSPTTYFLSLIGIIGTFKAFTTLWIFRESLALGTTDTFSLVVFVEFFEKLRYGYASAMAFVLFGVILSLTLINNRIQGSRVFYG